jgi:hypothetical protein
VLTFLKKPSGIRSNQAMHILQKKKNAARHKER